jgi:hypothetical protein
MSGYPTFWTHSHESLERPEKRPEDCRQNAPLSSSRRATTQRRRRMTFVSISSTFQLQEGVLSTLPRGGAP